MTKRVRSAFELEVFDQSASAIRRLESFMAVYVQHFSPKHRTDTNQLLHFMRNPLPGRRIIYFGLTFEKEPCGFCVLMYYPASKIGIFDFIVIAPNRRGDGSFFVFSDLVSRYLEEKRIIADYFVAEIVTEGALGSEGLTPQKLARLLRHLSFKRARIPYTAPDPSMVQSVESCRAVLMIASTPDQGTISAAELMRIVDLTYFDHYLLWYGHFMTRDARSRYERAMANERARIAQAAKANDPVILNGMKDIDVRLEPASETHRLALIAFVLTSALVTIALGVIPGRTTAVVIVLAILVLVSVAVRNRKLRRRLLRLFDL